LVGGEFREGKIEYRPDRPKLFTPYPNPFQQATRISFFLPEKAEAEIRIIDMNGKLRALFPASTYKAGISLLDWQPELLPAGLYIIQLYTEGELFTQKLIKN